MSNDLFAAKFVERLEEARRRVGARRTAKNHKRGVAGAAILGSAGVLGAGSKMLHSRRAAAKALRYRKLVAGMLGGAGLVGAAGAAARSSGVTPRS